VRPRFAALRGVEQRAADRHAAVAHVRVHIDAFDAGNLENLLIQAHVRERAAGETTCGM
jgi:hypothetical protein